MQNLLSISNALLAASSSSKTSASSSIGTFVFIVVVVLLVYVFFLRPRTQQARRQKETLQQVSVGDEVLTGAGIFGRILDVEADRITIETAPGTRITVLRSTIARRLTEPHVEEETGWSDEDTHEALSQGQAEGEDNEVQDHGAQDHHEGSDGDADDDGSAAAGEAGAG
jgi:preprotein translocase subunit YajC